jgi:hypothetical protein
MSPKKVKDFLKERARRKAQRDIKAGKKGGRTKAPTSLDFAKLLNREDFFDWAEATGFKLYYRPSAIDKEMAGRDSWEDFEVMYTGTSKQKPHRKGFKPKPRTRKIKLGKLGLPSIVIESIDYEDQDMFVATLVEMGFSEKQAFALWHSP